MKKFIEAYRTHKELQKTFGNCYAFCWSEIGNCFFSIYATKERIEKDGNFEFVCF